MACSGVLGEPGKLFLFLTHVHQLFCGRVHLVFAGHILHSLFTAPPRAHCQGDPTREPAGHSADEGRSAPGFPLSPSIAASIRNSTHPPLLTPVILQPLCLVQEPALTRPTAVANAGGLRHAGKTLVCCLNVYATFTPSLL